jgi:hypothetical protein
MPGASLKIVKKLHKERAQPADSKKKGFLERHKDYVVRAKDFHRKQDTLKKLRRKAAFKNPDEFYNKMQNAQLKVWEKLRIPPPFAHFRPLELNIPLLAIYLFAMMPSFRTGSM